MEIISSKVDGLGVVIKEEKSDKEVADYGKVQNRRQAHEENSYNSLSAKAKDSNTKKQDDELESAKVEMGQVREENERLKTVLARTVKDYQSLQLQFFDIMQRVQIQKPADPTPIHEDEEHELISLSLGRRSSEGKKEDKSIGKARVDENVMEGLALGLDCKFDGIGRRLTEPVSNRSPEDSFVETKEPPSKLLKTKTSGDEELSQQPPMKKARVSVRARCDTPMMNDGCQWRKYGQKIAKGNPCPRAYYRCTVAPACPVRKQVQRCVDDTSILITTYEGTHNHPLPVSATAMASTTSAAAYMLSSGSTSSRLGFPSSGMNTTTNSANFHGLNFSQSDSSRARQFYIPNTSISSSPSCPTITLDLTAPSPSSSLSQHPFNRLPSNFPNLSRYSPTSLTFASGQSNTQPASWGNKYLNYGAQAYNNQMASLKQQEQFYQPKWAHYLQPTNNPDSQQSRTDTITAATKAVTSDPTFQSALASAITSILNNGDGANANQGLAEGLSQYLKRISTDPLHPLSSYSSSASDIFKCPTN